MTKETKRIVLAALNQYQGDDVFRARAAFGGLSPQQMQEEHGQSGQTRQQILDDYESHYAAVQRARSEIEAGVSSSD